MAAFFGNSSFDVRERNSVAITLNIHTKSHRGVTHTKTCGAFWERVGPRTLREINLRAILYERTFYREISNETCYIKRAI